MFPGSGDQKELGRYLAIGQVGLEMAAPVALGVLIDSYFRCSPWAAVVGAVIGLVGGLAHLVHMAGNHPKSPGNGRSSPSEKGRPGEPS